MLQKALITGINGFVGAHLTTALLAGGYDVVGYDHVDDIEKRAVPRELKVFTGDIRDEPRLQEAIHSAKPDVIFHLAAQSSVKLSFEDPAETFAVNVNGTLNVLEIVSKLETPPRLLLVSSSEIYGVLSPEQVPVTEDAPMAPVNPYAVSKATVDLMAHQYFRTYRLPVYWVRAFSHTGPGQRTVAALSDWAFQAAKIELGLSTPVIKVGNLDATRDFTDVRDTVQAYIAVVGKGQPGKPYNVCSGRGHKLGDLLDIVLSFSSKKIKVVPDPSRLRPVDIPILIGSFERLRQDTSWVPTIEIETTLRDIYAYWIEDLTPMME